MNVRTVSLLGKGYNTMKKDKEPAPKVTLHKYKDKTGLIPAGPTYRRGFSNWRASGKRAD